MKKSEGMSLMFTLASLVTAVRSILKNNGMSEEKANRAILLAIDAERQYSIWKTNESGNFDDAQKEEYKNARD